MEPKRIEGAALARLAAFDYPGNVRQLENLCRWLTVMAPTQLIQSEDLPADLFGTAPPPAATFATSPAPAAAPTETRAAPAAVVASPAGTAADWAAALAHEARTRLEAGEPEVWKHLADRFEGELLRTALALTHGRRAEAAQKLGIGRNTITRKMQELGLED